MTFWSVFVNPVTNVAIVCTDYIFTHDILGQNRKCADFPSPFLLQENNAIVVSLVVSLLLVMNMLYNRILCKNICNYIAGIIRYVLLYKFKRCHMYKGQKVHQDFNIVGFLHLICCLNLSHCICIKLQLLSNCSHV